MRMQHRLTPLHRRPRRSGAVSVGLAVLIIFGILVLIAGATLASSYNGLASRKTTVDAKWAELDSQYKRRYDLIPQLVETVKGAANFERSTLDAVVEARSQVGRTQLPSDPAAIREYDRAQTQLSSALSRLLVVVEQYPQLKASQNFLSLQDQIEGTENRIAVARNGYIDTVRDFNTKVVTFPSNVVAGWFDFAQIPQLEAATPAERTVPKVEFDFGGKK